MNLLVIGGSDTGISAALRGRKVDSSATITVVLADAYRNFSICGPPYFLSGDVREWRSLAHRTTDDLAGSGIATSLRKSPNASTRWRRRYSMA